LSGADNFLFLGGRVAKITIFVSFACGFSTSSGGWSRLQTDKLPML
jgi:hypothetical protein